MPQKLTHEELLELVIFDHSTGDFFWKGRAWGTKGKYTPLGYINTDGHTVIKLKGVPYMAHRLAWFYAFGDFPKFRLGHKDGNRGDNRINNLGPYRAKAHAKDADIPASIYLGVSWHEGSKKWRARHAKLGHLGVYDTQRKAQDAWAYAENHGTHPPRKSNYMGVTWDQDAGQWRAKHRKFGDLGLFSTENLAREAWVKAQRKFKAKRPPGRGVTWDKERQSWRAQIRVNKQTVQLGRFATEKEALEAVAQARDQLPHKRSI